jgi:hypothetical protein
MEKYAFTPQEHRSLKWETNLRKAGVANLLWTSATGWWRGPLQEVSDGTLTVR